ncbi:hypothetical protein SC171_21560 [Pantoea cypripedii]|uniref:hypothetical protein n=1 Tax=Pantoea cypripedii TaxID=55209 RepID=UPI002FC9DB10
MTEIVNYNIFQKPVVSRVDEEDSHDGTSEQPTTEHESLGPNKLKAISDEIRNFLNQLQRQRKNLEKQPALCEQMYEQCSDLKLRLNRVLLDNQLAYFQSSGDLVRHENQEVTHLIEQMLDAENLLEQAESHFPETERLNPFSDNTGNILLKQDVFDKKSSSPAADTTRILFSEDDAIEPPQNNPLLRAAPTENKDVAVYAAEPAKDDITTIGQDKMTPEEQFWHELSMLLAGVAALEDALKILETMTSQWDYANTDKLTGLYKKFEQYMKSINSDESGLLLDIPDGLSKEQVENLVKKTGLSYEFKDGQIKITSFNPISFQYVLDNLENAIYWMINPGLSAQEIVDLIKNAFDHGKEFILQGGYKKYIQAMNSYYPVVARPPKDDSTLSGWLQGMLPAFDTIDKSNVNFYKSIISLITSWQSKINEFNKKYAEVLKSSDGVDQSDSKHRFSEVAVREMVSVLDDISALESQMALILGGVTEADLANLLEGTGINSIVMVGSVTLVDLGSDIVKMLKDAVNSCFSYKNANGGHNVINGNILVSPEQLTQFNNVLSQAQTQFDTVVKKVNTKTDSAKTLFNDTKEALSNLIKTAESLLADLVKMIR